MDLGGAGGGGGAVAAVGADPSALARVRDTQRQPCPAGSEVFLWAPDLFGTARIGSGEMVDFRGELPSRRAALAHVGRAGASTAVTVSLHATRRGTLPHDAVGCLDRDGLSAAVAGLKRTGAVSVDVTGNGVRAELPEGTSGIAVLAAPRIAGWSCGGRPADSYLGLVATPLDAGRTSVECTFRPPGLRTGTAVAMAGLVGLAAVPLGRATRSGFRRRGDTKTSSS